MDNEEFKKIVEQNEMQWDRMKDTIHEQQMEIEELKKKIKKAYFKLSCAKNHYKDQKKTNAVEFAMRILKGEENNE